MVIIIIIIIMIVTINIPATLSWAHPISGPLPPPSLIQPVEKEPVLGGGGQTDLASHPGSFTNNI